MASATMAMWATERGKPENAVLPKVMTGWVFNSRRRDESKPNHIARALRLLESNTVPVSRLDEPAATRALLEAIATKLDGTRADADTVARKYASVLARRPYDLRRACVSTWLAAGVPSTQPQERVSFQACSQRAWPFPIGARTSLIRYRRGRALVSSSISVAPTGA